MRLAAASTAAGKSIFYALIGSAEVEDETAGHNDVEHKGGGKIDTFECTVLREEDDNVDEVHGEDADEVNESVAEEGVDCAGFDVAVP